MSKSTGNPEATMAVTVLCELLICYGANGKPDAKELARTLDLKHTCNVPRKINSIIKPYGFAFEGGKVVRKDSGASAPSTPVKVGDAGAAKTPKSRQSSVKKRKKVDDDDDSDQDTYGDTKSHQDFKSIKGEGGKDEVKPSNSDGLVDDEFEGVA